MGTRFSILILFGMFTWKEVILWTLKPEEEYIAPSMKERLQQFLFPPQNLQSPEISKGDSQSVENKPGINKESLLDSQSYQSDILKPKQVLKRSSNNEQIFILLPLNKNTRKIRSNLNQQHMVKLDLARTDIPWDIPSSVVLDDGIRKICLDMVTTSAKKRKKADNHLQYSEDEFKKNKLPLKFALNSNSEISDAYGYQNLPADCTATTTCATTTTTCATPTTKPPICLNLQISNLLSPDIACKTKILNNSQIDPNGNVRLNILFTYDNKEITHPMFGFRKSYPSIPSLPTNALTSKELSQILSAARLDSLNKINKWMNSTNTRPVNNNNNEQINSIKSTLFQLQKNNLKNFSNINNNNNNNNEQSADTLLQNPLKSETLPNILTDSQNQLITNAGEHNEVNTTLALRTLLGLIQLMQSGNNQESLQQTGQDSANRPY